MATWGDDRPAGLVDFIDRCRAERAAAGLPAKVTDISVIERIAAVFRAARQARTHSGVPETGEDSPGRSSKAGTVTAATPEPASAAGQRRRAS